MINLKVCWHKPMNGYNLELLSDNIALMGNFNCKVKWEELSTEGEERS